MINFFPELNERQVLQFIQMTSLYQEWNTRINVISRKDIEHFEVRHLLHSLAIAKIIHFEPGTSVMDAGTGGGFPGIPLAVMFPETRFCLVDSIAKKIKVIDVIKSELGLQNVETYNERFEKVPDSFDFITGRAVSNLSLFYSMVENKVRKTGFNALRNGVLYLTGGETGTILSSIPAKSKEWNLSTFFSDPFFETKKLIHLTRK